MSSASDRNGRPEDLANFAPKWARDPALKEKRDALRLASDQSGRGETDDDAPPVCPPAAHRDADVSDLRIARAAPQTLRRRADEGEMFTSEENVVTDPHRISRSLDPTIMQEPPRRPRNRGVFTFLAAAAGAAAVVAVIMLLVGGKVPFEWTKAGSSTSDASFGSKVVAKTAPEPERSAPPAAPVVSAPPPVQVANAAGDRPTPEELPSTTPVRKAIEKTGPVIRGVSDNEIRFGMSAPFSGPARELGQQMKIGVEAAFKLANEAGGVHGRQLSLVAADDGYEPERTAQTMKQLYDTHQVFGIVGNVGTPTAVVALPYALEKHMLFYGAFTGAPLLRRDPPDRYVFNYRASYAEETDAV